MRTMANVGQGALLACILLVAIAVESSAALVEATPAPARRSLSWRADRAPALDVLDRSGALPRAAVSRDAAAACGHDAVPDARFTLELEPNDRAGVYVDFGSPGVTKDLRGVDVHLIDMGQQYPTRLQLDVYEQDETDTYGWIAGFSVQVDADPTGEVFSIDLAGFGVRFQGDLLLLYGDANPGPGLMLPAGDSSPRCYDGSNVCSVLLPVTSSELYIYGRLDPKACDEHASGIQMFDLVVDVRFEEVGTHAAAASWSSLKARY